MGMMNLLIQIILSCVVFKRGLADSESDPDYAVAYDAAVAYLKANPYALNRQADPYIYVQIQVDDDGRSNIDQEIQDIHLPSEVLKEIQDSYVEKAPVAEQAFIDVEMPYNQPEPYVDIQVPSEPFEDTQGPHVYQGYPYIPQAESYNYKANPYVHQANPYVYKEVPYVHDEKPYVHDEIPYVHDEPPYVHEEMSYVDSRTSKSLQEPSNDNTNLYLDSRTAKNLPVPSNDHANPYVDIQLTLRVPYDELESTTQHFADPALEYAYRTQQRQPRKTYGAVQRYNDQYRSAEPAFNFPRYGSTQYGAALNDFDSLQNLVNSVQWKGIK